MVKMTGETSRRNRKPDDAMKAAIAFVERINACDAEGLCELTTEDHRFVDSTGAAHVGRERMREAWLQYFAMFPDYRIAISTTFSSGERAALFGTTCATYAANGVRVEMHAAWLAVVRGKRIADWRAYADNEPARTAMRH